MKDHRLTGRSEKQRLNPVTGEVTSVAVKYYDKIQVLGQDVALQVDDRRGTASFEISVPRLLRGTNEVPAQPEEVAEAMESIHRSTSRVLSWDCDWGALEVGRIDIVRGFDNVFDIDALLHRLSRVSSSTARIRKVFNDPRSGGASTFTAGVPKRWMATIYDKATELAWAACRCANPRQARGLRRAAEDLRSRGHVRTEISVRRAPLKERLEHTTVTDIAVAGTMDALARHYFQMAGFDRQVGGTPKVLAALGKIDHGPDKGIADRVLAMIWRDANGVPQVASRRSLETYRPVARDAGLTGADFVLPEASSVRLDWEAGLLVEEEAA